MQVAVSRMADVRTDAELKEALRSMMRGGDGSTHGLRTFIAELEGPDPISRYPEVVWDARPTGIDGVSVMSSRHVDVDMKDRLARIDQRDVEECELCLDRRDGRFCLVHADMTDDAACRAVELLARTTSLRRAWILPRSLAEYAASKEGNGAKGSVRIRREDSANGGHAELDATYYGMITTRGGTSIDAHLEVAREIRSMYAQMLAGAEECRQGFEKTADGTYYVGRPIWCSLSKKIEDVGGFADSVFDGGAPLRMFGKRLKIAGDAYHVPVVDLEAGAPMDVVLSPQALKVHIPLGHSGSAALRLMAYVQHRHDAGLDCPQVTK